jgi:glycerol-3-phosphate dehydrogenase
MAHGGIRYLENGEFRLVREAVRERNRLLRNAPHSIRPLPTAIPIFRIFSGLLNAPLRFLRLRDRPAERGALLIKLGLLLYDAYTGGDRTVPGHRFNGRSESGKRFPDLNPDVRATAIYYDGAILSPERLCLEMILDAEAANPNAQALNYCAVVGLEAGRVVLEDLAGGGRYTVEPAAVVNAAGPWIDGANRAMQADTGFIGGTKGSHLVLDHPELHAAIDGCEFFFENDDGRIVLICPFFDRVLVGTSDIRIEDPDEAVCTEEEVDYFLEMVRRVFPAIRVDRESIVFRFAGVRPLPARDEGSTGQISRDHHIENLETGEGREFPVFSLIGGKWTTFRAFSAEAADRVLDAIGRRRVVGTENLPIGGGLGFPENLAAHEAWSAAMAAVTGIATARANELLARYGTYAERPAWHISAGTDRPLFGAGDFSRREIEYLGLKEMVVHLDDLLLRRTSLAMLGRLDLPLVEETAAILAGVLGWDEARRRIEIERALRILRERHGVDLGPEPQV